MSATASGRMKWTAKRQHERLESGICRYLHRVRVSYLVAQITAIKAHHAGPLRILDLGCGDGVITRRLRERLPEDRIDALDADRVRLERARQECQGIRLVEGDVTRLPYRGGTFDVVVCHHVVEHVVDDIAVLRECHRVLAPGGALLLGIPHEGGVIGRILRKMHRRLYEDGEHVNFYTIAGMRKLILDQGFRPIDYAKFGFLFPHYYVHLLLLSNELTFRVGHRISQRVDATADSLIFLATKPPPSSPWPEAAAGRDDTRLAGRVLYDRDFGSLSQQESSPPGGDT